MAQQVVSDTTRVSHYPLTDGLGSLGSVRALVDTAGATVLERSYSAFGAPQAQTGSAASTLGFTGEVQDAHTGQLDGPKRAVCVCGIRYSSLCHRRVLAGRHRRRCCSDRCPL